MITVNQLLNDHVQGESHVISQDYLNAGLLQACKAGRKFFVHKLARSGAMICNKKGNCTTALHIAAQNGFLDIAAFLLYKGADVNALDHDLNTALILAINPAGSSDMLNLLLAYDAKVDCPNSEGMTALMKAVEAIDIDAIKILMSAKSDVTKTNKNGQASKDIAVKHGIADVFEHLAYEAENNLNSSFYANALTKAMLENHIEAVKIFLDCIHTDIEYRSKNYFDNKDEHNLTLKELVKSMSLAAQNKKKPDKIKLEMANILLANISQSNNRSGLRLRSCLIEATRAGVYELVEVLCKYEDFRPYYYRCDHPALTVAAQQGRTDILKLVLSYMSGTGGEQRKFDLGDSALCIALENGQTECAKFVLQNHRFSEADLNNMALKVVQLGKHEVLELVASYCEFHELAQSLLRPAVLSGSVETVKFVLNHGADINIRCSCGDVALVLAVCHLEHSECMKMVTFLVKSGARVDKGISDQSPLVCAVSMKRPEIVRYLLESGADVNEAGDDEGINPLIAALLCTRGILSLTQETVKHIEMSVITEIVKILLEAGADPNKATCLGNTAIHVAVIECCSGAIPLLLNAGAELEVRNFDGLTPLLLAADKGIADTIGLLKRYGANMAVLDNDGSTALLRALQSFRGSEEDTLRLLAYDKDQVNKQSKDGLTPLMLAAKKCDFSAVKILLELGADPNIVNDLSEKTCTALSILLENRQIFSDFLPCAEELIKHNGLDSIPNRCCLLLFEMIMSDERQMIQLMVTHGMAPLYANLNTVDHNMLKPFIRFVKESVKENMSPLATALLWNRLEIAQYMLKNWFLTRGDLVGSPQLPELRNALESLGRTEAVSFMDEHLSQPMPLIQLSFVAVSAFIGETAGRAGKIRNTPLPTILQNKLLFQYGNVPIDLTYVDGTIKGEPDVLIGNNALQLSLQRSIGMNSMRNESFQYLRELIFRTNNYYNSDSFVDIDGYYTNNGNYETDDEL
ncbi:ankyrin-3 [Plakobranchus ocellatus]|uniref:Ankyrin-3 n=1 Tax=Plakobranchus ocellatus TaxID=259542 RepID=A0AAV3ZXV4_9GAST|nr:ankyrin-3 [Plakobranchus ocellatus]